MRCIRVHPWLNLLACGANQVSPCASMMVGAAPTVRSCGLLENRGETRHSGRHGAGGLASGGKIAHLLPTGDMPPVMPEQPRRQGTGRAPGFGQNAQLGPGRPRAQSVQVRRAAARFEICWPMIACSRLGNPVGRVRQGGASAPRSIAARSGSRAVRRSSAARVAGGGCGKFTYALVPAPSYRRCCIGSTDAGDPPGLAVHGEAGDDRAVRGGEGKADLAVRSRRHVGHLPGAVAVPQQESLGDLLHLRRG
jgi:hypothetical protein